MDLRFPAPLRPGDTIAVTSPSAGVEGDGARRIDFCVDWLRQRGYDVRVGACMDGSRPLSGPKAARAAELTDLLCDPDVRAVVPPWGGPGTAIDLLDQLDYDAIAQADPTWLVGFSDLATVMLPLTLVTGLATLHGDNLADTPYATPEGLVHWLDVAAATGPVVQHDSGRVKDWVRFADDPHATRWRDAGPGAWTLLGADRLDASGVLVGGCLETLASLAGTPYGDVPALAAEHGDLVVFLEASEHDSFDVCRHLHALRYAGWFDRASAILVGRTRAPGDPTFSQRDAVVDALGMLDVPIVVDLEIGHVPPHLPLVIGAQARVVVDGDRHEITQSWTPGER